MKKIFRLKKNHVIALIVKKKQRIVKDNYIVYYQFENEKIPKIAFSVSKKYGHAVERNKAKRIARQITRKIIYNLKNVNMVVVIKNNSKNVDFEILENELLGILKKIKLKQMKGDNNEIKKI